VHCRDGEEAQLHSLAQMISERVNKVTGGSSGLTEVRQLLYAALLLADDLTEQGKKQIAAAPPPPPPPPAPPPPPEDDPALIAALEQIALRAEALADHLAAQVTTA
jgi:cell division protein ZapA